MRFAGTQLSNFMGDTTDFSQIAGTASNGRRLERQAAMKGEGMVGNYGLQSLGKTKSAEFQADSIIAQGQAQGQASMMSGLASGIGSIAGGISSRGSSGGGFSGASMKATGAVPRNAYSTYTPSYNFFG